MKYLGINLTKYIQDLYEENYKTPIKEIKKINGEMFHVHGRRLNIIKMSVIPNMIYSFNSLSQNPHIILCISTNWFWNLHEKVKDLE